MKNVFAPLRKFFRPFLDELPGLAAKLLDIFLLLSSKLGESWSGVDCKSLEEDKVLEDEPGLPDFFFFSYLS